MKIFFEELIDENHELEESTDFQFDEHLATDYKILRDEFLRCKKVYNMFMQYSDRFSDESIQITTNLYKNVEKEYQLKRSYLITYQRLLWIYRSENPEEKRKVQNDLIIDLTYTRGAPLQVFHDFDYLNLLEESKNFILYDLSFINAARDLTLKLKLDTLVLKNFSKS